MLIGRHGNEAAIIAARSDNLLAEGDIDGRNDQRPSASAEQ